MNASALGQLLQRAEADEPVYVTDVRRTFLEEGGEPLAVHAVMFDGTSRCFRLCVPAWTSQEEKDFVLSWICAEIYNLLSAAGASELSIYVCPGSRAAELAALLPGLFQTEREMSRRTGYGKCLNVNERILKSLYGEEGTFRFLIRDIGEAPEDVRNFHESGADGFTENAAENKPSPPDRPGLFQSLPEAVSHGCWLGIDVGGTDIKYAVCVNGRLVSCREYDWDPSVFTRAEQLTGPVLGMTEALLAEISPGDGFDGIGLSFPDVVIRDRIVGGETPKTKGMREGNEAGYEAEFRKVGMLAEQLKAFTKNGTVRCINDGSMAAFTAAAEMAAGGKALPDGFFACTLGTDLGSGWVRADGSVPQIPLELYNMIIDLGSFGQKPFPPEDIRSIRNISTGLAGSVQKYTSQSGVYRLAAKRLPESAPELLKEAEEKGYIKNFRVPGTCRKTCLDFFMKCGHPAADALFREIGEYLAVCMEECEHLLHQGIRERFLFGRLVREPACFRQIREGAAARTDAYRWEAADEGLAQTPLMKDLSAHPAYTVAQFAQAVGAVFFAAVHQN